VWQGAEKQLNAVPRTIESDELHCENYLQTECIQHNPLLNSLHVTPRQTSYVATSGRVTFDNQRVNDSVFSTAALWSCELSCITQLPESWKAAELLQLDCGK
jgi:hypothetical protein